MTTLRNLPSIEQLLQTETTAQLIAQFGRPLTLDALRQTLDDIRARFKRDPEISLPSIELILSRAESTLTAWTESTLLPVINATGVILHTNLGRAPMSEATIRAMNIVSKGYSNLEFDLESGKRGSRLIHAEALLQKLTGAESAIVVNNNASAVLLTLSALANRKRVVNSLALEIGSQLVRHDVVEPALDCAQFHAHHFVATGKCRRLLLHPLVLEIGQQVGSLGKRGNHRHEMGFARAVVADNEDAFVVDAPIQPQLRKNQP